MRDPRLPLQWDGGSLWILDQRKLPARVQWIHARTHEAVAKAIEQLAVRGAPAIGIAAAYGVAIAAMKPRATVTSIRRAIERLRETRPTAVNLFEALKRTEQALERGGNKLAQQLEREAVRCHRDDAVSCRKMAKAGLKLFETRESVLTYCNTGALATGGIGTALGVIKHAFRKGRIERVYVCETRPVGQGARLTVWECSQAGIPVTLICDNMAAALMATGRIDRVLVGADRIARNGDTCNKIGTLALARLAKASRVPFHVVAPWTTIDTTLRTGTAIPIEERAPHEVTAWLPGFSKLKDVEVWNPAFDLTPARLITNLITDRDIITPNQKTILATQANQHG